MLPVAEPLNAMLSQWRQIFTSPAYFLYAENDGSSVVPDDIIPVMTKHWRLKGPAMELSIVAGMNWSLDLAAPPDRRLFRSYAVVVMAGRGGELQAMRTLAAATMRLLKNPALLPIIGPHCPPGDPTVLNAAANTGREIFVPDFGAPDFASGRDIDPKTPCGIVMRNHIGWRRPVPVRPRRMLGTTLAEWCQLIASIAAEQPTGLNCRRTAYTVVGDVPFTCAWELRQKMVASLPAGTKLDGLPVLSDRWLLCPGGMESPDTIAAAAVAVLEWLQSRIEADTPAANFNSMTTATLQTPDVADASAATANPFRGFGGIDELMKAFGLAESVRNALKKRLERMRLKNAGDSSLWNEMAGTRTRDSRFLYKMDDPRVRAAASFD